MTEALRRTGKLVDPVVELGGSVPPWAYRTTLRLATGEHRLGLRSRHSHDVVELDACPVSHPLLQDLLASIHIRGSGEVSLRVGAATGERSAWVVDGDVELLGLPPDVGVGPTAQVHEVVAGHSLRISAASFFQSGPAAAELLVAAVRDACGEFVNAPDHRRCLRRCRPVRGCHRRSDDDHCRIVGIRVRRRVGKPRPSPRACAAYAGRAVETSPRRSGHRRSIAERTRSPGCPRVVRDTGASDGAGQLRPGVAGSRRGPAARTGLRPRAAPPCTTSSPRHITSRSSPPSTGSDPRRRRREAPDPLVDAIQECVALFRGRSIDVVHRQPRRAGESMAQHAHRPADDATSGLALRDVDELRRSVRGDGHQSANVRELCGDSCCAFRRSQATPRTNTRSSQPVNIAGWPLHHVG